jgi:predicted transcriptional regulator
MPIRSLAIRVGSKTCLRKLRQASQPNGHTERRLRLRTQFMKIAVSIRDDVFRRAERLAEKSKRSRSRLYSNALEEYLARHGSDEVTDAMNQALAGMDQSADAFVAVAACTVLAKTEWAL